MKNTKWAMLTLAAIFLTACSQKYYSESPQVAEIAMDEKMAFEEDALFETAANVTAQTYAPESYISSSAALENPKDTARKMIRTADIKFKVKDVIKTVWQGTTTE